ncbi:MAG TPA: hypothetical protein DCY59_10490, partial [Micrococcaceae bacterium]|nr:hypothetical protein [Micrococcaceae bacterium]
MSGTIHVCAELAVISQHPRFNEATGTAQLAQDVPHAPVQFVLSLATELNLMEMLPRSIGEYSPGELRRLEVLRALVRVHTVPECNLLLADEPTAHLDEDNAHRVRRLLSELPARCAILIASHDPLIDYSIPPQGVREASSTVDTVIQQYAAPVDDVLHADSLNPSQWNPRREVVGRYASARKALCYGVLAILCAVALAGLSGWLIVESSYQPPILHLTVAFVMVRTLGIGRAVFRYLEQLAIHDAVLSYAGDLREQLWNAMVANPAQWGVMSRSSVILRYLLAEVDELRDGIARVLFPPLQATLVWVAATVVLYLIQAEFGYLALTAGLLLLFPVRWLVKTVEGRQLALQLQHRLQVNELVLSILRHKEALRAFGALDGLLRKLSREEQQNTERTRRHAYGQGTAPALATLITGLLSVALVLASDVNASYTALAVLLVLSLGEPASNALNAIQQGRALSELTGQLARRGIGQPDKLTEAAHP